MHHQYPLGSSPELKTRCRSPEENIAPGNCSSQRGSSYAHASLHRLKETLAVDCATRTQNVDIPMISTTKLRTQHWQTAAPVRQTLISQQAAAMDLVLPIHREILPKACLLLALGPSLRRLAPGTICMYVYIYVYRNRIHASSPRMLRSLTTYLHACNNSMSPAQHSSLVHLGMSSLWKTPFHSLAVLISKSP